jgi:plasmid stabilization system protein ParE
MKPKIVFIPEAENDLREAFLWYEDKRQGLGYDFLLQVDAAIQFIKRNPQAYPTVYKETRKVLIKRFPYKIIYLVKENHLVVLAVLHSKRNQVLLNKRIGNTK